MHRPAHRVPVAAVDYCLDAGTPRLGMNAHKITEEEAYALLRRTSNQLNRKLHDIANDVTVTGALP